MTTDLERHPRTATCVLPVIPPPPTTPIAERCCPEGLCRYRAKRIHDLLQDIDALAQGGWSPAEALGSVLGEGAGDTRAAFGPGRRPGPGILADLQRAIKAGHHSPFAISRYLCPYAELDEAAS